MSTPSIEGPSAHVSARALTKAFETRFALRALDVDARGGDVVAVLGPNGAGKSTLLALCSTLSRPTSGELRLFGLPCAEAGAKLRGRIGVCAHATFLYEDLTVRENLEFYAKLYGVGATAVESAIDRFGITPRVADRVRTLSRGWQQRVAIARALLHEPDLVLLDEPTTGLDASAADHLAAIVDACRARGNAVLVATHDFAFAGRVATRVIVLAKGRSAYDGPCERDPAKLAALYADAVERVERSHPRRGAGRATREAVS
jgi:ABC-type multidrug transport system ATPase subunit